MSRVRVGFVQGPLLLADGRLKEEMIYAFLKPLLHNIHALLYCVCCFIGSNVTNEGFPLKIERSEGTICRSDSPKASSLRKW